MAWFACCVRVRRKSDLASITLCLALVLLGDGTVVFLPKMVLPDTELLHHDNFTSSYCMHTRVYYSVFYAFD